MKNSDRFQPIAHLQAAFTLGAAAALLLAAPLVRADDPVTMAPPIQPSFSQSNDGAYQNDGAFQDVSQDTTNTSQDSVFNWTEVPQNQRVPLTRAVFDKGGYQLYDTQGETIIVPFANQNLYVMKFGLSDDGSTYFVNEGTVPVLYLPRDGYLENASAPGTRWFPFPKEYHYEQPVFLGVAPSYPEFVDMGWYPGMVCYGGYYSYTSFVSGGIFLPTFGLSFFIGGHPYHGWHGYHNYYDNHPAPYHVTIVNNNFYREGGRPSGFGGRPFSGRPFVGTGHPYYAGRSFGGGGRSFASGQHFGGVNGGRSFGGGAAGHTLWAHHTFRGVPGSTGNVRTFGGGQPGGVNHTFQAPRPSFGGGDRTSGNAGRPSSPSFGGADRQPGGGHTFNGGSHTFNSGEGGRSFDGGQSFPAARPTNNGGGRSFGGGRPADSGHSSGGGGGRPAGGGQSNRDGGGGRPAGGGGNHR